MEKQVIDEVKRSFGRALSNKSLIQEFYDKLLQKNPEIKKKFAGIDLKK